MRCLPLIIWLCACPGLACADLYVSGFNTHAVGRFDETTGAVLGGGAFIAPGAGGLNLPHGILRQDDGTFLVASAGTDEVLRYSASGAYLSKFIANGQNGVPAGTLDYPVDLEPGPGGDLLVSSQLNDRVVRFDRVTGALVQIFVPAGTVDGPSGLAWDASAGRLYVAGRFGNQVMAYDAQGVAVPGFTAAALTQPFGVALHPATAQPWVVDGGAALLRRLNGATGTTAQEVALGLTFPVGIRFGADGDLFVADYSGQEVARYDGSTGAAQGVFLSSTTLAAAGVGGPNFFRFIPAPTVLEQWRLTHLGTLRGEGPAADQADPDGDGVANLLEFATGQLPAGPRSSPGRTVVEGGVVKFLHTRSAAAVNAGWQFIVEWTDTLTPEAWSSSGVQVLALGTTAGVQEVEAVLPSSSSGRVMARLRVLPPP